MRRRVAFFEFSVFDQVFPLASAYMEATACRDSRIKEAFDFDKYSMSVSSDGIAEKVGAVEADVYAFSCYVWNMGLVKRLLQPLLARRPEAHVILGGPQVMNKGEVYLDPGHQNLVLCNGEGELTFGNYLAQIASDAPDLSAVQGLSFYRDGELVVTPKQERLEDLGEIPSPYLEGYVDPQDYVWAVLETNRGCPFRCTYCYWGGATNAKVHKFTEDRIFDEITWLSRNQFVYIFLADANFGMLKRDVDIARHIARCKQELGYPMTVYFNSSKNTPERVTEITQIFHEAGLTVTQPISMQTLSDSTLDKVKRSNIKRNSYTELQKELNKSGLSSFLEMIWPLPGETLDSFRQGLGELCRSGADSFIIYPLLLINNVEMADQRDEFGLLTIEDPDPNSEAEIVVGSRDVTEEEYQEGVRFSYHLTTLYSVRSLWHVARHLDAAGLMTYDELVTRFSSFCRNVRSPYTDCIEDTLATSEQYKFSSLGKILHTALHSGVQEFDQLLSSFMRSLDLWDDEHVRFLFELDLLNRPCIYSNTPLLDRRPLLESVQMVSIGRKGYTLEMPEERFAEAGRLLGFGAGAEQVGRVDVRLRRSTQFPFMKGKPLEENYAYCQDKLHKMASILPVWSLESQGAGLPARAMRPSRAAAGYAGAGSL